jgi:hypothetical protein
MPTKLSGAVTGTYAHDPVRGQRLHARVRLRYGIHRIPAAATVVRRECARVAALPRRQEARAARIRRSTRRVLGVVREPIGLAPPC